MPHDKSLNCFALPELLGNYCTLDILKTKMITWACSPTIAEYICFVCANII